MAPRAGSKKSPGGKPAAEPAKDPAQDPAPAVRPVAASPSPKSAPPPPAQEPPAHGPLAELRRRFGNPYGSALAALLLGLFLFLPGLGGFGFWEPQETMVADAARFYAGDKSVGTANQTQPGGAAVEAVVDPSLRPPMLQTRLLAQVVKQFGVSEWSLRFPLALLGALGLAAVAFAGAWLWRPRAGFYAAVTLGTAGVYFFQARQLGGDITTFACGALVMAFLAPMLASAEQRRPPQLALWCGLTLAASAASFFASGAVLGVALPFSGAATALWAGMLLRGPDGKPLVSRDPLTLGLAGVLSLAVIVIGALGMWALAHAPISGEPTFSALLGVKIHRGVDTQTGFDDALQRIGFGFFPWTGVLVAAAFWSFATIGPDGERKVSPNSIGRIAMLTWAIACYAVVTLWAHRIGEVQFVALPACALLCGIFLSDLCEPGALRRPLPVAGLIILATSIVLARDFNQFPQKLASLPFLHDSGIAFPPELKLKIGIVVLGIIFGSVAFLSVWARGNALPLPAIPAPRPGIGGLWATVRYHVRKSYVIVHNLGADYGGPYGAMAAAVMAIIIAFFFSFAWTPRLSQHFSYRAVFDRYHDLAAKDEPLAAMGVEERGVRYYAHGTAVERIEDMNSMLKFFQQPGPRHFAIIPFDRLGSLQQTATQMAVKYYVVDKTNARFSLVSNQVKDASEDLNPLRTLVLREPPADMASYQAVGCDFEGKVELAGIKIPSSVSKGANFEMSLLYKVKAPVGGSWKVFVHFDGPGLRFHGDHDPVQGLYNTNFWTVGDYIIDTFKVKAGDITYPAASFTVLTGFWPGGGSESRLKLSVPPDKPGLDGHDNRCLVTHLSVN